MEKAHYEKPNFTTGNHGSWRRSASISIRDSFFRHCIVMASRGFGDRIVITITVSLFIFRPQFKGIRGVFGK